MDLETLFEFQDMKRKYSEMEKAMISMVDEIIQLKKEKKKGIRKFIFSNSCAKHHVCKKEAVKEQIDSCAKRCYHAFTFQAFCVVRDKIVQLSEQNNQSIWEIVQNAVKDYIDKDVYDFCAEDLRKNQNVKTSMGILFDIDIWKKLKRYQKKYNFKYLARFMNYVLEKYLEGK